MNEMTVQQLIDKLSELPQELRGIRVLVETEDGQASLIEVSARTGNDRYWWQADHVILSGR